MGEPINCYNPPSNDFININIKEKIYLNLFVMYMYVIVLKGHDHICEHVRFSGYLRVYYNYT